MHGNDIDITLIGIVWVLLYILSPCVRVNRLAGVGSPAVAAGLVFEVVALEVLELALVVELVALEVDLVALVVEAEAWVVEAEVLVVVPLALELEPVSELAQVDIAVGSFGLSLLS